MIGDFSEAIFLDLHRHLAVTPGPSLNEAPRRAVLEQLFSDNGVAWDVDGAGSLWVHLGPEGAWSDAVVFDAHIDVVEKGYTPDVQVTAEHLQGLGVGDDLVAVTMLALAGIRLQRQAVPLKRPLYLLFSVGEEGLGNLAGVRRMVADHGEAPHLFAAFDGTFDTYSISGLGSQRFRVEFSCAGGHSWGSFGVPSATEELVLFLHDLRQAYQDVAAAGESLVSFNIGTLEGGEGINSISRHAAATFEFRSAAPDLLTRAAKALEQVHLAWAARRGVDTTLSVIGSRPAAEPVEATRMEALVTACVAPHVPSLDHEVMSTNINVPLAQGWPSVRIGLYRGRQAHREDEQVERNSLPIGWRILDALCTSLLG